MKIMRSILTCRNVLSISFKFYHSSQNFVRGPRNQLGLYRPSYNFSNKNDKQNNNQGSPDQKPTEKIQLTQREKKIKDYEDQIKQIQKNQQEAFREIIGLPRNYSFKNELIISQETYSKSKRELKEAILFEDLLKNQLKILIYDTKGKPYFHHILKSLLLAICAFGVFYGVYVDVKKQPKLKVLFEQTEQGKILKGFLIFISTIAILRLLQKNHKTTKRYIEKIVYNTENQSFTFTKRRFYGRKYTEEVSRFKILYTQNEALRRRGTNYLNIDNLNEYSIPYVFAWKREDLFSHLISQRIKK